MVKLDADVLNKLNDDELTREQLLSYGSAVLTLCFRKVKVINKSEADVQGYLRIINNCIGVLGPLLRDSELDQLKRDVEEIKLKLGKV